MVLPHTESYPNLIKKKKKDSHWNDIRSYVCLFEQLFPPLLAPQVLGFEVDSINSVQFSNHTGWLSTVGAHCPTVPCCCFMSERLTCPHMTSGNTQKPRKNSGSRTELGPLSHLISNDDISCHEWVVNVLCNSSSGRIITASSSWILTGLRRSLHVTRGSQDNELQNLKPCLEWIL